MSKPRRKLDRLRFSRCDTEGRKAAIYIRVSQEELSRFGDERASVQAQRADCVALCKAKGWPWIEYAGDSEHSGSEGIETRMALKRMLEDVASGKIHSVVCRESKRLARNAHLLSTIIHDYLLPNGVPLVTIGEQTDISSPDGRFMAAVKGWQAESELFYISEKSRRSKQLLVEQGRLLTKPPYGYKVDRNTRTGVVVPEEAEIVKELFQRSAAGEGLGVISQDFMRRRIRNGQGTLSWQKSHLLTMLRRSTYCGRVPYLGKSYPGLFPPIVNEALWLSVQTGLDARRIKRGPHHNYHLLTGTLKCGPCLKALRDHPDEPRWPGMIFAGKVRGQDCRYRCQTASRLNAKACPDSRSLIASEVDGFVDDWVKAMVRMDFLSLAQKAAQPDGLTDRLDGLEEVLKALVAKRARLAKAYADGLLDEDGFAAASKELSNRTKAAEAEAEAVCSRINASHGADIGEALDDARRWDGLNLDEKRIIISKLIDRIVVWPDRIWVKTRLEGAVNVPLVRNGRSRNGRPNHARLPHGEDIDNYVLKAVLPTDDEAE